MSWTRCLLVLPLLCLGCIPESDPPPPGALTLRPVERLETQVASSKRNPLAKQVAGPTVPAPPVKVRSPGQVDPRPSGLDPQQSGGDPPVDPNKRVPRLPHVTVPDVRGNRPRPQRTYTPDPVLERLKALGSDTPPRR